MIYMSSVGWVVQQMAMGQPWAWGIVVPIPRHILQDAQLEDANGPYGLTKSTFGFCDFFFTFFFVSNTNLPFALKGESRMMWLISY